MKHHVKKTNKAISIILILCITFSSFSVFAYTNIDNLDDNFQLSAHDMALQSLTDQLNNKGIGLYSIMGEDNVASPSGYDFKTRVSYEINEPISIQDEEIKATITFMLDSSSERDISFDYKVYPGSAFLYNHYEDIENGRIIFTAGQTEKSIEVTINEFNYNYDEDNPKVSEKGGLWTGERVFYISCYNISNALFENQKETMNVPVRIENSLNLKQIYDRAADVFMADMSAIQNAESFPDTPGKYINTGDTINISSASAITANVRKMIDTGTFSHLNLPAGYFLNAGATGEVNLEIETIYTSFSQWTNRSTNIVDGENIIDFGFNDIELYDLGLGGNLEGNAVVNSLGFSLNYLTDGGLVYTLFHDEQGNYVQNQINFEDKINPFPVNCNAPTDEYCLGESIPITVSFNEAVLTDNISINANDTVLYPVERNGTVSESASFLYEIGDDFKGLINISDVKGAVDLSGKSQDESTSYSTQISNTTLKSYTNEDLFSHCAETNIEVNQGKGMNAEVVINLSLKANEELSDYLLSHKIVDGSVKVVKARVIGEDGNAHDVELYANDGLFITALTGSFTAPESSEISDENYVCEIYFDEDGTGNFELIYSLSKQYTLAQIIYIDDESDLEILYENWPVDNKISSNSADLISLSYNVKNNATWQKPEDFVWVSSDNTVASITTSGAISLTGKPGSVTFSLTALNSGQPDEQFTLYSNILQVIDTNEVFLNISGWSKNAEIIKGSNAKIYYSTNIPAVNGAETTFSYKLYEGQYEAEEFIKGDLIFSDTHIFTAEKQELYYEINNQYLSNVSERGKYSYQLEISAKDLKTDMLFTASAFIRVKSLPAKAVLSKQNSYYITDEVDNFKVKFDVDNHTPSTEVIVTVAKNESEPEVCTTNIFDRNKDIVINVDKVDELKLYDTYMVSLRAKNGYDEAYSYDSYVMYVYNSEAFKISVNGVNKDSHTMSLYEALDAMTSEEILNLNRNIALTDTININTKYKWSNLFDKTTWSVGDDNILSLKYKDGGLLDSVNDSIVLPGTQLLLEGLSPGQSYLTMTHNLTGMEEKTEITVENLRDKLFLFQVFPAQKSKITYISGENKYKLAETDEKGKIAIFERTGIKSDIAFEPENSAIYDTFLLTNNELKSMQEISNNNLYPQNNIHLKKSDYETSFHVRLIDAKGRLLIYEDTVIVKGGVYRNGVYCPGATINGKSGKEEQIVELSGYEYVLKFDHNEFVNDKYQEPITSNDKIEYVFEVSIPDNTYYSKFVKVDNETIQLYRKNPHPKISAVPVGGIFLESKSNSKIENNISIASQKLVLAENETKLPDNIIIEDISKSAYINTYLTFKGDIQSKYTVKFLDKETNVLIDSFSTEVEKYEFSDSIFINNFFDVRQYVSNFEFGEVRSLNLQIVVESEDGFEIINFPSNYNVSRINGVRNLSSLETGGLNKIGQDFKSSINGPSMINSGSYDDYIQTALSYLSGFKVDSQMLRLEITPTDNPLVFKGVIMMGVGEMTISMKPGVYSKDKKASHLYDYMPDYDTYNSDFIYISSMYMNSYMGGYGSNKKLYGGGAYFDCEIFYDINSEEWKIVVLKSFTHVGGGYHYQKIYNTWIGPVPVTAEFLAGGTGQLNLKTVTEGKDKGSISITEFSPYVYLRGFGGVGRDYKVVSFKAGVYGKASIDQQYLWLKGPNKNSNGQRIKLAGETGIEYEIKLVVINVGDTYKIGSGSKTWTFNDYNNIKKQYDSIQYNLVLDKHMAGSEGFNTHATFEDRSYLANERYWNSLMARKSSEGGTTVIQSNAYPYSNPVLSTDGEMMVYLSDMDSYDIKDTSVCFSLKSGGAFLEGAEIDTSEYADTDVVVDGTSSDAAAAWTRVITDMKLIEGSEATAEDIQNMLSCTEIMASIYNGTEFVTTRLTDNFMADMSPVVATNGEKTIVAWRSFYAGDIDRPLSFDGRDNIMYRVYDGSAWSEEKCLYDGSIDSINTFNAKMLSDGTSAITYEVTMGDTDNAEIYCAIIDDEGNIKNIRLSNNEDRDENPQITSVAFPDKERFVIGYSVRGEGTGEEAAGNSAIRVTAVDGKGNIYNDFETEVDMTYSNFKFTRGSENIEDLSIVWVQPEFDAEDNYSHALLGRKFFLNGESYMISPEIKLLKLDDNNLIDHYDAHVNNAGKIGFMLQTTDYNTADEYSNIIYGQTEYKNKISIEEIYYNRNEIIPGNEMPLMFRIYNSGIEPINNLNINFGGIVHEFGAGDYIMPGQYKDINIFYLVPETITDAAYSVTGKYPSSLDIASGNIKLNVPDVGIYGIDVVKEAQRERIFSVMLHNSTFSKLTEGKHTVKLYAYDSPDSEAEPIATEAISDAASLNMINNGMLIRNVLLDEEALQGILNEEGEIPDDGKWIFFKAAIEEDGEEIEDADISNDWDYVKIRGLIGKNMERVSIASRMKYQSGRSTVQVELTNNSMNEISGGNIVVKLKNESGRTIETKQFGGRTSLIVAGEESFSTTFDFNSKGTSFEAVYIAENPDDGKDDKKKNDNKTEDYINPFIDVNETDWFYDAVKFVLENGLMIGTGADTFGPELSVTRGMLVTILHRLENWPAAVNGNFDDVRENDYYYDAVAWAKQNGIVSGIDQTRFCPNENITREQFAAILYRYFLFKNNGVAGIEADLSEFEDNDLISSYAFPALQWAVGEGLIKGRGEHILAPKSNSTRAETAIILQRFIEKNR